MTTTATVNIAFARTALASAKHATAPDRRAALLAEAITCADGVLAEGDSLEARQIRNEARWMA